VEDHVNLKLYIC